MNGITLESYVVEALPYVLGIYGGSVFFDGVDVAHWTAGGRGVINDPTTQCLVVFQQCSMVAESNVLNLGSQSLAAGSLFLGMQSTLSGESDVVEISGRNAALQLQYCRVVASGAAENALSGMAGNITGDFTVFEGDVDISDNAGVAFQVNLHLNHCQISGDMNLRGDQTTSTIEADGGSTFVAGTLNVTGVNVNQDWTSILGADAPVVGVLPVQLMPSGPSAYAESDKVILQVVTAGFSPVTSVFLPELAAESEGRYYVVKDISGNATASPIEVKGLAGQPIDGNPSYTINSDGDSATFFFSTYGGLGWHSY